jgi:hypothetical protein
VSRKHSASYRELTYSERKHTSKPGLSPGLLAAYTLSKFHIGTSQFLLGIRQAASFEHFI